MSRFLHVSGVCKSFGEKRVLADAGFSLPQGGAAFVGGANGSGKTTFLKILAGLLRPDSAREWEFDSRAQTPRANGVRGAVLLHQNPYMFAATVRANVEIAGDAARAAAALAWAGMEAAADMPARALSGGERARVSLARAHAASPKLCLLDEPLAHLDAAGESLLRELLALLRQNGGAAIIAAPRKPPNLPCDSEWLLKEGKLQKL
ncbi:MAG: ABC transporter ATP-binding protein [Gammaproteobacteria bacterium]